MRQDDAAPLDLVDVGVTEQTQSVLGLVLQNVGRSSHAGFTAYGQPVQIDQGTLVDGDQRGRVVEVVGVGSREPGAGVGAGRVSRWAISAIRVLIR